jgi:hypothetical protein
MPYFGQEIDIQAHGVNSPGRSISPVNVFLKGRKYQIAGDRAEAGEIKVTIYNDPDLVIRRFFLKVIDGIQSYDTPLTISNTLESDYQFTTDLSSMTSNLGSNVSHGSSSSSSSGFFGAIGKISDTAHRIQSAYEQIKHNITNIRSTVDNVVNEIKDGNVLDLISPTAFSSSVGMYTTSPWYQTDIVIQQLDHDGNVALDTTIHSAFVTDVSDIEYQDETGTISTTEITFAYTDISYGSDLDVKYLKQ